MYNGAQQMISCDGCLYILIEFKGAINYMF